VVLRVTQADTLCQRGREEIGRDGLDHALKACLNDAVADLRVRQREACGTLPIRQLVRGDVGQMNVESCVGEMACDSGSHRASAKHGHGLNSIRHEWRTPWL